MWVSIPESESESESPLSVIPGIDTGIAVFYSVDHTVYLFYLVNYADYTSLGVNPNGGSPPMRSAKRRSAYLHDLQRSLSIFLCGNYTQQIPDTPTFA